MGISSGPKIVRDSSLVTYIDAADRNSVVSGSLTFFDLTNINNTFTLYNGAFFSNNVGGSLGFDGIDDGVSGSNASAYSLTGNISVEVWTNIPDSLCFVYGKGPSNGAPNNYPGNYELQFASSNGINFLHQTTTIDSSYVVYASSLGIRKSNTWEHVVLTCDGTTGNVYINGVSGGNMTRTLALGTNGGIVATNTQTVKFGRRTDGAVMSGSVAVIKVYNKVLTSSEVIQNYTTQKSRFGL